VGDGKFVDAIEKSARFELAEAKILARNRQRRYHRKDVRWSADWQQSRKQIMEERRRSVTP
jgi:hypothetical protein